MAALYQIPVYKTELFCMTTMIDLIVTPRLRNLDMNKLPKILRTHITSRLHVSFVENTEKKIIDKLFYYAICATLFEFFVIWSFNYFRNFLVWNISIFSSLASVWTPGNVGRLKWWLRPTLYQLCVWVEVFSFCILWKSFSSVHEFANSLSSAKLRHK